MSLKQFTSKNSNLWKWLLFVAVSSFSIGVVWSVNHMTPGLLLIAVIMGVSGTLTSIVYTVYTTHVSPDLRKKGWASEGFIIGGLVINLIIHAGLSRRYDVAQQARAAEFVVQERQRAMDKEKTENELKLIKEKKEYAATEATRLANVAKVTEAQNRQLYMLDRSKRRQLATGDTSRQVAETKQDASAETTPAPLPTSADATGATNNTVKVLSPEQVQEQAWWFVLLGILLEIGTIGGTIIYFVHALTVDSNGNGIADWMEKIPAEVLWQINPDAYRVLYGEPRQPQEQEVSWPNQVGK